MYWKYTSDSLFEPDGFPIASLPSCEPVELVQEEGNSSVASIAVGVGVGGFGECHPVTMRLQASR